MSNMISDRKRALTLELNKEFESMCEKYKDVFITERSQATKIEGTEFCMIIVPCKFANKRVIVSSLDLSEP